MLHKTEKYADTMPALSLPVFRQLLEEGAWILDTRPAGLFIQGFVPGSVSISLDGQLESWAKLLLPATAPLLLITLPGSETVSYTRLLEAGFSRIAGCLQGGMATWTEAGGKIDMIIDIDADELAMDMPHDPRLVVIDIRREGAFEAGHVRGASNFPLESLADPLTVAQINEEHNLYLHGSSEENHAITAASLLKRQGYHSLRNISGGYESIRETKGIPLVIPGRK